ncbi:hypothetical protein GTP44_03935 [Duganella sp. FT50W]|uniref:NinG protein n=2 Tax=Duganella lactea TaxID=2692173 RepID=A0A6L8MNZ5_9BURK|nr:hypothetical protein [Duganella lactea]
MKQGGFARAARIEDREVSKIKTKAAREKKHKCAVRTCRAEFVRLAPFVTWCSPECGTVLAMAKLEKQRQATAAAERKNHREQLIKLRTKRDYVKLAQVAFNAYIRARDAHLPCICCDRTSEKQYLTGTNWDCGHYRSTGSAPHLRFHEDNAHRQLTVCNRYGAGRAVDYRIGLIARIGLARVEALERDQEPRHYTVDQLIALTAHYKKKLKELKAAAA